MLDLVIWKKSTYFRGIQEIEVYDPHSDDEMFSVGEKRKYIGISAKVIKKDHDTNGQLIRLAGMPFEIEAASLKEAFDKFDASEAKAMYEATKPKIISAPAGVELPKLPA